MKTCSKCKEDKDKSLFSNNKKTKDKLSYVCKVCYKKYYTENREKLVLYGKNRRQEKKEVLREISKVYYTNNQERIKSRNSEWSLKNKEKVNIYKKRWKDINKDKLSGIFIKSYHKRINGIIVPHDIIETIVLINKTKRLCRTLNN